MTSRERFEAWHIEHVKRASLRKACKEMDAIREALGVEETCGCGDMIEKIEEYSDAIAALRERIAGMEKDAITREWVILRMCEFAAQAALKGVRWGMDDAIKFFDAAIAKEPK